MVHYGTLSEYRFEGSEADDIRGAKLYGLNDEKLGKIDDVIFDHSSGDIHYVVVDTGGWLSSRKFLVPTERLRVSPKHDGDFETDLDKKRIEDFPPYQEEDVRSKEAWDHYEERYKKMWKSGPVQHREGTDRNISPAPEEMPPAPAADVDYDPEMVNRRVIPPTGNEVTIPISGAGLGDRWSNFEQLLRERRKEVTEACPSCSRKESTSQTEDLQRRRAS